MLAIRRDRIDGLLARHGTLGYAPWYSHARLALVQASSGARCPAVQSLPLRSGLEGCSWVAPHGNG